MSKQYASAATSLKPSKAPGEAIHARCDAIDGEGSAVMMGCSYWAGLDHAQELNTGIVVFTAWRRSEHFTQNGSPP